MKDNSWVPVVVLVLSIVAVSAVVYDNITVSPKNTTSANEPVVSIETTTKTFGVERESDSVVTADYHRQDVGVVLYLSANREQNVFYWAGPATFSYSPKSIKLKPDGRGAYKAKIEFSGSDSVLDGTWCAWVVQSGGSVKLVNELPPKTGNEGVKCPEFPK